VAGAEICFVLGDVFARRLHFKICGNPLCSSGLRVARIVLKNNPH